MFSNTVQLTNISHDNFKPMNGDAVIALGHEPELDGVRPIAVSLLDKSNLNRVTVEWAMWKVLQGLRRWHDNCDPMTGFFNSDLVQDQVYAFEVDAVVWDGFVEPSNRLVILGSDRLPSDLTGKLPNMVSNAISAARWTPKSIIVVRCNHIPFLA